MHPHPKVGSWLSSPLCVYVCCVNMCARMCTRVCETRRGNAGWNAVQERTSRPQGEPGPPSPLSATAIPLPLASSPRYRKKRGPREVMRLPGRNSLEFPERTFSPFLHARILYLSPLPFFVYAGRFVRGFFYLRWEIIFLQFIYVSLYLYTYIMCCVNNEAQITKAY